MRKEVRLSGFGGQGIILAGQILGQAASIHQGGRYATLTQSYGPEARGGACAAEVVISDEPIGYPYVVAPQIIVAMSQEAYSKYATNAPDALIVIDPDLVKPDPALQQRVLSIPATRFAREMERPVVANIIMLGFLAAVSDVIPPEALRQSVLATVPKGTGEFNMKAFKRGYDYGLEHGKPA